MGGTLDNRVVDRFSGRSTSRRFGDVVGTGEGVELLLVGCALLGFGGPNCFLLGMLLAVVVGGCFLCGGWVVFWPADHQRVVVVGWTGRTLRTTQWTRASSKTHESFLGLCGSAGLTCDAGPCFGVGVARFSLILM